MNGTLGKWVFGVLTALSVTLASAAVTFAWNANTTLVLLAHRVAELEMDSSVDAAQNRRLCRSEWAEGRHWGLLSVQRDWINGLRATHGLPILSWPERPGPDCSEE